jgi:hypothetical protein
VSTEPGQLHICPEDNSGCRYTYTQVVMEECCTVTGTGRNFYETKTCTYDGSNTGSQCGPGICATCPGYPSNGETYTSDCSVYGGAEFASDYPFGTWYYSCKADY